MLNYIEKKTNEAEGKESVSLSGAVTNEAPEIRGAVDLYDAALPYLRVTVNPPEGISQVLVKVNGRSAVYPVKNRTVLIPVRIYELFEPLTVSLYNGTGVTEHGSLTVRVPASAEPAVGAISCRELAEGLELPAEDMRHSTTLAQIETILDMSYVLQLFDGRFVIFDGGTGIREHDVVLRNYLVDKAGGARPVIACWFISHLDPDHVEMPLIFMENYSDLTDYNAWLRDDSIRERGHYAAGRTVVINMATLTASLLPARWS